jgi:adenylylsulfate kinase
MTGTLVWITGLPSAGKSSFARAAQVELHARGTASCLLDGDEVRHALLPKPGYDIQGRNEFYATLANLAVMLAEQPLVVLVAATAHRRAYRDAARARVERFLEVWIDTPLEEVRRRDTKGLYRGFLAGERHAVPGEDLVYEPPLQADVVAHGGTDPDALTRLLTRLVMPPPAIARPQS